VEKREGAEGYLDWWCLARTGRRPEVSVGGELKAGDRVGEERQGVVPI